MHTQRVLFKWLAIVIAIPMFFLSGVKFPLVSAQGENPSFDEFHWEDWGGNANQKLDVSPYNVAMDSYYHEFQFSSTPGDRNIRLRAEAVPHTIHVMVRWIYQAPPEGSWPSYQYHMNIWGSVASGPNPTADLDVQPGTTGDLTLEYDIIRPSGTNTFYDIHFDISGTGFSHGASTYIVAINQYEDIDGPVEIEITDSTGNPVDTLALNSDGWPTPNPLTVDVTLTCPTGGSSCDDYDFNFNLNSGSGSSRFFLYESTILPNELNCLGDMPGAHNTYGSFELSCDYILFAGQSVSYQWKLWVQPSDTAQLIAQAEYGGDSDTKTISIPKAAIHPIAFIPGDGVSHQFISNTYYDSLLQTLEKMGYERDQTLFPWDYSPINSFVDTAEKLAREMAQWQTIAIGVPWVWRTPEDHTSFDMVAHSAGVMVTRAYVQLTQDASYTPVNKLLLGGGTNKGILSNYAAREGLYGDNPVFKTLLGPVLDVKSYECGNYTIYPFLPTFVVTAENKYMTLHERRCGILSAPEQLPAPGPTDPVYLIDLNSNPYPFPASPGSPDGYQYNPLLQAQPTDLEIYPQKDPWYLPGNPPPGTLYYNLNGTILADLAKRNIPVQNVHILYSDNIETNLTYKVTNPSSVSPLWRNGIWPITDENAKIADIVGDGAVAQYSAAAPDLWPGYTPHRLVWLESGTDSRPEKHGNLMVYPESQQEIGLTLSGIMPPFSTPMTAINELFQQLGNTKVIHGFGLSPVELLVIDPLGQRLGYDPATGQILKEIPLGVYVRPTDQPVEFAIYEPMAGDYTITVTGTGSGPYTLLDVFTDEHASVPILFEENTIQLGGTYTTTMTVPASSGDVPYPPEVNAGIDLSTTAGTLVAFEGTIEDINPNDTFDIQWDFGDGSTAAVTLTPSHTYTIPDTYVVTLTVTDSAGFNISDTMNVEVLSSASFPFTSILDNFNRANGPIGSNWSGYKTNYEISSNQLRVKSSGSNTDIYWSASSFGPDQEAYVTFSDLISSASEHDLLLKSQSASTWGSGVLEVWYDAPHQRVQVWTYKWPQGWVQRGADIPVTFVDGDTFGARARPDGTVEVYRNGELLATRDITAWPHYADGGYIGLWFAGAYNARLDDFGGGTVSGGGGLRMPVSDPSGEIEDGQLNVELQEADVFWQGVPIGTGQAASVTFATLRTDAKTAKPKPQSNGVWGEGTLQLLYDVPNQRIQVWMYQADAGWAQVGRDMPVRFAQGDQFRALVDPDGVLELYHNSKLFAK